MPNRILRADILTSEPVCSLDWAAEVFYRRLLSVVDDYGRHEAGIQLLRSKCYPLQTDDVRVADITRWMAACQKAGLIALYEVAGKRYLEVAKFGQQRRTESKFPPPPDIDINCYQAPANEHLGGSVSGVVSEDDKPAAPSGAELFEKEFWPAYPKKKAKDDALKAFLKRKPDRVLLGLMLTAIAWQRISEDWVKEGGKFVPYPATWLNDGRWTDEKPTTIPSGAVSTVPGRMERDPELIRREKDAKNASAPSLETLERIARIKQGVAA